MADQGTLNVDPVSGDVASTPPKSLEPAPIDRLRAAGFSDEEVGQWSTDQRQRLTGAGFNDADVDSYLTGQWQVPAAIPPALLGRVVSGNMLTRIISQVGKGIQENWGDSDLGFSPEAEQSLRTMGVFPDPATGQGGPIRMLNEATLKPAATGLDAIGRAISAGVGGIAGLGAGLGQEMGLLPDETQVNKFRTSAAEFANIGGMLIGTDGMPLTRPRMTETGRVIDEPIGNLPKGDDFGNSSQAISGGAPQATVQPKLGEIYQNAGVHPAEVAADAQRDVTISQSLLSADHQDIPAQFSAKAEETAPAIEPTQQPADFIEQGMAQQRPEPVAVGISAIPNQLLGDVTSTIYDNPGYSQGADSFKLPLRKDEISDLRGAGVNISDDGIMDAGEAERLLQERTSRAQSKPVETASAATSTSENVEGAQEGELPILAGEGRPLLANDPAVVTFRKEHGNDATLALQSLQARGEAPTWADVNQEAARIRQMRQADIDQGNVGIRAGEPLTAQARLDEYMNSLAPEDRAKLPERWPDAELDRGTPPEQVLDQTDEILGRGKYVAGAGEAGESVLSPSTDSTLTPEPPNAPTEGINALHDGTPISVSRDGGAISFSATGKGRIGASIHDGQMSVLTALVPFGEQGKGYGTDLYASAIDYALNNGLRFTSGASVSQEAQKLYEGLARRGYDVRTADGVYRSDTGSLRSPSGSGYVYEVLSAPKEKGRALVPQEGGEGGGGPPVPPEGGGGLPASPDGGLPATQGARDLDEAGAGGAGGRPPGNGGPPMGGADEAPVPYGDAQRAILDHISVGETTPGRRMTWGRLYTEMFDKLYPVARAEREAMDAGVVTADRPYRLMRMLTGNPGRADVFLNRGTFDFLNYRTDGPSLRAIMAPIKEDLNGFRAFAASARAMELEKRGIETGFDMKAARQVVQEGREQFGDHLMQLVAYQDRLLKYLRDSGVISDVGYTAAQKANRLYVPFNRVMGDVGDIRGRVQKIEATNPVHKIKGSSRRVVDPLENLIRNTYQMIDVAERNEAMRALVNMLEGQQRSAAPSILAELVPDAEKGPIDVPFAPADEQLGGQKLLAGPQKGGPLVERIENPPTDELHGAIRDALKDEGFDAPDEMVDALHSTHETHADDTVAVFRNGVRETYRVDPDIARAVKGLDRPTIGFLERILATPASWLRAGATAVPDFALRHLIRDSIFAFVGSGGKVTPIDIARGIGGLVMKDKDYWDWLKAGGGQVSRVSFDRRYLQENLAKLTGQTGLFTRAWNVVLDPEASVFRKAGAFGALPAQAVGKYVLHPMRVLTELAESASHLAAFKQSMRAAERQAADVPIPEGHPALTAQGGEATMGDAAAPRSNISPERQQILQAGWDSREVSVDNTRIGASMRAFNMISAFANATIQDTDRVVRAMKDDPVRTAFTIAAAVTIPSALLWWANHKDPRYQEIPEWERDTFWHIMTDNWKDMGPVDPNAGVPAGGFRIVDGRLQRNDGIIFRIPKPFATGVVFGSAIEKSLDQFADGHKDAFKDFASGVWETTAPTILPTAVVPMLEQFSNRSTYTNRTLMPSSMEAGLPEYQYTQYTTETAKALGSIIGAFPGIRETSLGQGYAAGVARAISSPILLENYLRAWTGTLGTYALKAADAGLRKAGLVPDPPRQADTLADVPIVRAFVTRYPTASTDSIQKFYDQVDRSNTFYVTWKAAIAQGDVEAAQRFQDLGGDAMFLRLGGIQKAMGTNSTVIRNINQNPDIASDQKRQLIDQLYYNQIQLAHTGNAMMKQILDPENAPAH